MSNSSQGQRGAKIIFKNKKVKLLGAGGRRAAIDQQPNCEEFYITSVQIQVNSTTGHMMLVQCNR